jgi:hypothetical protein
MAKVVTTVGELEVQAGKEIIADNLTGFTDGEKIVAFNYSDRAKFKVAYGKEFKGTKHLPEGSVIDMHVIDAAVAEKMGKGSIVK